MIALLRYGPFTAMIQLPAILPVVTVLAPENDAVNLLPLENSSTLRPDKIALKKMEFTLSNHPDRDIAVYDFVRFSGNETVVE